MFDVWKFNLRIVMGMMMQIVLFMSLFSMTRRQPAMLGRSIEQVRVLIGIVLMKCLNWNLLPTMCMLL